jgi:surfactin synthase thioesterase subunit
MNERSRKYQLKKDYFDSINTPEKAYFLGILYADGCNSPETNSVRLILTESDKTLLEQLSNLIHITHQNH